jgi:hypothetical protein
MLVTAGGNLVTKDEILSRVWRGIVVEVDDYDDLTADEHRAISYGNAWTLFPRLVPKHDTASRNAAAHDRGGRTSA